jgi:hypothetical protein
MTRVPVYLTSPLSTYLPTYIPTQPVIELTRSSLSNSPYEEMSKSIMFDAQLFLQPQLYVTQNTVCLSYN